jgi:hypothetical protein
MAEIQNVSVQIVDHTFYRCAILLCFILVEEVLFHVATRSSSQYPTVNAPSAEMVALSLML